MSSVTVRQPPRSLLSPGLGLVLVFGYAGLLVWSTTVATYDTWAALLVTPALLGVTLTVARRVAAAEDDPTIVRLLMLALLLKLAGSLVRHFVAFDVYDGSADAAGYVATGRVLAPAFRDGIIGGHTVRAVPGTGFIEIVTGVVFALIGPTVVGGFLVFSWLSFLGLLGFYRAFRLTYPEGDGRRYAQLVLFLPSLLFWPSSIGKESWMIFALGVSAYGVARIFRRRRGGLPLLVLGVLAAGFVRPHMAVLLCAAVTIAYAIGRRGQRAGLVGRVVGVAVLGGLSVVALQQTERFFGVEDPASGGVETVLDETERRTSQGGSSFEATSARSLTEVPRAVFAVIFRPLPHEAHNLQALVASLEGAALLALCVFGWRRLSRAPVAIWRNSYVLFATVYTVLFCVAFSSIGNFGILARQRAQLFPFVLVLLALPYVAPPQPAWRVRN